jgi:competence protein ComEC
MRKLMWFSLGFVLATIIGIYFLQGTWYFLASGIAALLLGALIFFLNRSVKVRITAMVILGCVVGFVWMTVFDYAYLSVARAADEEKIVLTITATDYSEETEYGTSVDGIGRLNNRSYKMRIYLPKGVELEPGDTITGRFSLRCTLERCSGESQYSFSHGIFLSARMTRLPVIDEAEKLPWYGYPAAVRQNLAQLINSSFPDDTAGFALALLIGDASGIDYETDIAFKVSGISHIIAVSGFHVTVLFALVYVILGKNRILSAILGLPLLFFFAAVAGFSASVTRACLMHSLMIIGLLIDKEYDPLTSLGFAALCMLALNPWTVANVSFQLSVLCMVGILTISDPIKKWILDRLPLSRCNKKMKKWAGALAASIAMCIGATVFVTPLCAYYFGMVSLVGVLTNLLTLWVISIVFYGIIAVCLISIAWIPLGTFLATIISLPIRYVLAVSKILADFPLAAVYTNSAFIVLWLIFAYFVLLVNCFAKKKIILEF